MGRWTEGPTTVCVGNDIAPRRSSLRNVETKSDGQGNNITLRRPSPRNVENAAPARLSRFRQITTSPERLLAFVGPRLDCTGAREPFHAFRFVGETGAALAG
jgi:hypothetical protein